MDELDTLLADFNRLKESCRKLEGQKIVVGIVGGAGSDVLKIAHAHEYGVPGKLPERSFIRASFDADKAKLGTLVDEQVSKVLAGQKSAEAAANAIGAQAAQMVQNFIDENRVKPPSDFSRKRVHTTLFETGTHIRDRISWEVEKK
ncbi:hypothetical protein [Faecalibaculum rodentium]|jgi:hypothetical protein|uniref:hypothetical protein n=1 Tax=Faecalibaculum rodentium TaxID=1702221 RepID=UPI0026F3E26A|nr:hypothetical protein [Faecalibaculum rodentium]